MAIRVASPAWVRVDAVDPAPWRRATAARIVHRGASAVVLDANEAPIVVTGARFGLVPGGIQLADADFDRVRGIDSGTVRLTDWSPVVVVEARLSIDRVRLDPLTLSTVQAALAGAPQTPGTAGVPNPMDATVVRRRGPRLAAAALAGEHIEAALLALVGAGPGSTPTGDDVIVGVLAGLHARGARFAASAISSRLPVLLGRTTRASAPYLVSATEGRFADRVHDLLSRLDDARRVREVVRLAATWGATSGLDLLSGIAAGALAVAGRSGKVPA